MSRSATPFQRLERGASPSPGAARASIPNRAAARGSARAARCRARQRGELSRPRRAGGRIRIRVPARRRRDHCPPPAYFVMERVSSPSCRLRHRTRPVVGSAIIECRGRRLTPWTIRLSSHTVPHFEVGVRDRSSRTTTAVAAWPRAAQAVVHPAASEATWVRERDSRVRRPVEHRSSRLRTVEDADLVPP